MSISQKSSHQSHEAVLIFADGAISKEMLYTEFEALLDCVVPMRECAGQELKAAYIRLDAGLAVVAVVLFKVQFDDDGFPEQTWNVPLRQLAEAGIRGPDLGGGPARLATRSQCPVAGQEEKLWDIEFGAAGNTLDQLRERVSMNRLGLDAADMNRYQQTAAAPAQNWTGQAPQHAMQSPGAPQMAPAAAPAGAESSDAMLALMQQSHQQMAMMREQHQRELMALQERLAELQQRHSASENEKAMLRQQFESQGRDAEEELKKSERKLQMMIERSKAQTAAVRAEVEAERDAALAARDEQLREELAARDRKMEEELARLERERALQEEQLTGLRTEITELRRDKMRLMGDGADKFFDSLKEKGVKFVAYQPGAGHLTIAMEDLNRYIEDTEQFVAQKCGVSVEQYRRWLAHYNNPVCQGSAGHGGPCAKPLQKLLKPSEFVSGLHDRCDIHKQVPRSAAARGASA